MPKETRELLTKEKILKDMQYKIKRITRAMWMYLLACMIGAVLVSLSLVNPIIKKLFDNYVVISVIADISLPTITSIFFIYRLCDLLKQQKLIKNGKYHIYTDTLIRVVSELEKEISLSRIKYFGTSYGFCPGFFAFSSFGWYAMSKNDEPLLSFCRSGDEFYIITLKGRNDNPFMVYSKKIYKIEDEIV